jgi:hypothetical protein
VPDASIGAELVRLQGVALTLRQRDRDEHIPNCLMIQLMRDLVLASFAMPIDMKMEGSNFLFPVDQRLILEPHSMFVISH